MKAFKAFNLVKNFFLFQFIHKASMKCFSVESSKSSSNVLINLFPVRAGEEERRFHLPDRACDRNRDKNVSGDSECDGKAAGYSC